MGQPQGTPPVNTLSMTRYGMEHPFGWFGQLSWLCPLPVSRAPPALSLAGPQKLKSPWLGTDTTQQQPNHPCATNGVLTPHPKHSAAPAAKEEINSIPAKTRTWEMKNLWDKCVACV